MGAEGRLDTSSCAILDKGLEHLRVLVSVVEGVSGTNLTIMRDDILESHYSSFTIIRKKVIETHFRLSGRNFQNKNEFLTSVNWSPKSSE